MVLLQIEKEASGSEGKWQHGFRTGHSTTTALLELQSAIAEGLDKNKLVTVYSTDLTAAFDLLRPAMFLKEVDGTLSKELECAVMDFLSNRKMIVEIEGNRSKEYKLDVGCVQGSSLGPRLFTLYCKNLQAKVQCRMVTYADDSYVIISSDTLEEAKEEVKKISARHISELSRLGMVVNKEKTEVVVFTRKGNIIEEFSIDGQLVKSKDKLKALGLIIDQNLSWKEQVMCVCAKMRNKLSVLRHLRPMFSQSQFQKIATAQVFSGLYYGSGVWMTPSLNANLWRQLNSLHYWVMRLILKDYRNRIPRWKINQLADRATPKEWARYSTGSIIIKVCRNKQPIDLYETIHRNMYFERRYPHTPKFFENSERKIGKQSIHNRATFMNTLGPWYNQDFTDHAIRILLKSAFFATRRNN